MRLIDADRLKINLYHNKKVVLNDDLVKCIDDTETAYDIDKVVAELEERTDFLKYCTKYGNKNAKQQAESYSTMMMYEVADLVDDLIEIAKHGCVSDDVCEWNLDGVYIFSPHKKTFNCVIDDKHRYTYCPVCGKKIKVVE